MWDFNVGGLVFEANAPGGWHSSVGTLVIRRSVDNLVGEGSSVLFTADVDKDVGSALIGISGYYLRDEGGYSYGDFGGKLASDESRDVWQGARAHIPVGRVESSVFLIWNQGEVRDTAWEHTGWATKAAADVRVGASTLSAQVLYSTGDDGSEPGRAGEFRTIAQSLRDDLGAQSYWSLGALSSPRGSSEVTGLGLGLQNRGLGLVTVQGAWEQAISARRSVYSAVAWLRSEEPNAQSQSDAIGTELVGEARWQLYTKSTAGFVKFPPRISRWLTPSQSSTTRAYTERKSVWCLTSRPRRSVAGLSGVLAREPAVP